MIMIRYLIHVEHASYSSTKIKKIGTSSKEYVAVLRSPWLPTKGMQGLLKFCGFPSGNNFPSGEDSDFDNNVPSGNTSSPCFPPREDHILVS